jgi:hypothetical protein
MREKVEFESGVDMSVAEKTRDTPCDIRDKTEQR